MVEIKRFITVISFCFISFPVVSQEIFQPLPGTGIYRFLDELAGIGIININHTIKLYSRSEIAGYLQEANINAEKLTYRQKRELEFYMRDFGKESGDFGPDGRRKDLFYHKDSLFSITFNPVFGGEMIFNSSGNATWWCNGITAFSSVGKLGIWATLRDNHEKPLLGRPDYLNLRPGGHIKNGTDWSEMRAGISWAWKWGSASLIHDNLIWGSGYNGTNIFSGHTPPFFQIKIRMKPAEWLEFNYLHGSLNSMVVDSNRSYWVTNSYGTDFREVYHRKYISANMFTIMPFKKIYFSAGNSIIYSDYGFNPVYLIPVLFYKSVDHSMNSGIENMNSQMFFDINLYRIKNLHLYGTLFIDELSVKRLFKKEEWNFMSYKAGVSIYNIPFASVMIVAEFTCSLPLTFQHYVPTLTFESNRYNLGHYLKDNSREWFFSASYRPFRTMNISIWFCDAVRGPDYSEIGGPRIGNPPLQSIEWHNRTSGLKTDYQIINDLYVWMSIAESNISGNNLWHPGFYNGKKTSFNIGVSGGF